MYLLELPAVAHGGDHLGELVLVTLEYPVDVLPSILPTQIVPGRYPATVTLCYDSSGHTATSDSPLFQKLDQISNVVELSLL